MEIFSHRPKHIAEYLVTRLVILLANLLPLFALQALGWLIAFMMFHLLRYRVDRVCQRIRTVFGDRYDDREQRRIAWTSLKHTVYSILELMRLPSTPRAVLEQNPLFQSCEDARRIMAENGRFIFALPHAGGWEFCSAVLALSGLNYFVIVRQQKNLLTDLLVNNLRKLTGVEILRKGSTTLKNAVRFLKQGKVLLILPDSHSSTDSIKVDFLGGQANLGAGTAVFARAADCPVFPVMLIRHGWNHHEYKIFPPVRPDRNLDKETDIQRMMQEIMSVLDAEIRSHPEQYLWYNKRWVLDPAWNTSHLNRISHPHPRKETIHA